MRAVVIETFGGPEVMQMRDIPVPEPGPGQIRIKVAYAALTPLDVNIRRGLMKWRLPPMPMTLGYEYAGTVDAVGPGVAGSIIGSRVGSLGEWGGYADYAVATAAKVTPIPAWRWIWVPFISRRPKPPGRRCILSAISSRVMSSSSIPPPERLAS